jgi:hypothetical protein
MTTQTPALLTLDNTVQMPAIGLGVFFDQKGAVASSL